MTLCNLDPVYMIFSDGRVPGTLSVCRGERAPPRLLNLLSARTANALQRQPKFIVRTVALRDHLHIAST